MIDDVSAWIFACIGAIGSAVTAVGIFFVYAQTKAAAGGLKVSQGQLDAANKQLIETQKQTRQTQMQLDNTFKPWMGSAEFSVKGQSITASFKNYGKLPATLIGIRYDKKNERITRDSLERMPPTAQFNQVIIYPDQKREIEPDKGVKGLSNTTPPQYIGILLEYEYPYEKKDSYGIIREQKLNNQYLIIDEWFGSGS